MRTAHHSQLMLDFDISAGSVDVETPEGDKESTTKAAPGVVFYSSADVFTPSEEEWTDANIILFVEHFLTESLGSLASGYAGRNLKAEVMQWLGSDDTDNPLSFVNCCAMLGYDSEELRSRALLSAKKAVQRDC